MSITRARTVLAVALLPTLVVVAAGCRACGSGPAAREREPLSLIPDDSMLVGSVDMGPVRSSAAYERVLRRGNPMGPYLGDCAYDPLPDIDRIWFGAADDLVQGRGSVVVMGRVDRGKVLDCFRGELRRRGLGLEELDIEGFTTYSAGPGRPHLAWVDQGTLVLGDRSHVERMLGLERGKGRSVRSNERLLKLYERVVQDRDVAVVAVPDEAVGKRLASYVPEEWQTAAEAEQIGLGARFEKGLDLFVTIRLDSGLEGTKLLDRLKRDLERWQDHDYVVIAGLSSHLKAIRLEGAGPEITARAAWTEGQVDTLTRLAVDSIEEVMRDGADQAAATIRDRLRVAEKGGPDAGPADAGARDEPRAAPDGGDRAPAPGARDEAAVPPQR